MRPPVIRTGYDAVLPVRVGKKFCVPALEDGVVESVSDKQIIVVYNLPDGKTKKDKIKLYSWTSKEEAGVCYTHTLVANVSKGDKFFKDDTLAYDKLFFEPDLFNPRRVIYKQGDVCNVAIMENSETFEDSGAISLNLSDRLGTTITKVLSFVLDQKDEIFNLVKIGDYVEPSDVLFSFMSEDANNLRGLDAKTIEILKELKSSSPKAKVKGIVSNIVVFYNGDPNDLSDSIRALAEESAKRTFESDVYGLKEDKGILNNKVDSSYSIQGNPLLSGEVEIKVYIQTGEGMTLGDKGILGNQMKFTVGEVFPNNIKTEDGRDVDALFSYIAIQKRIVTSPTLIGTTSVLIEKLEKDIVKMYFEE